MQKKPGKSALKNQSKNELNEINHTVSLHGFYSDRCVVCLMDFEEEEEITHLPCQHYFHSLCITKWLQLRDACPLCQKSIKPPKKSNNTNTKHT
jgi:hypothetical protein